MVTGDAGALTSGTEGTTDGSMSSSDQTGIADATTDDTQKLDLALPDLQGRVPMHPVGAVETRCEGPAQAEEALCIR